MRSYVSVPLPPLSGGVNRFEREARPDQAVSAENVINKDGELCRRESFSSIACGAPHHAPSGSVMMMTSDAASTVGNWGELRDSEANFSSTNTRRLYIGAYDKFDGIEWGIVAGAPSGSPVCGGPVSLKAYYSKVSGSTVSWHSVSHIKDTTKKRVGSFYSSLCQDGQISFHSDELTDWAVAEPGDLSGAVSTLPSSNLYWIRLDIWDEKNNTSTYITDGDGEYLVVSQPGIRVFQLNPVNGIFPVKLGDRSVTVVCNDRQRSGGSAKRRPHEAGAQIGVVSSEAERTRLLRYKEDEGTGVYGAITWNQFTSDGGTAGSATSGPALTLGTADRLRKNITGYDWLFDSAGTVEPRFGQFRGGVVAENLVPQNNIPYSKSTFTFLTSALTGGYKEFEHCRLRITATSGSGNAVGQEREITASDATSTHTAITVYNDFPNVINGNERFAIIRPHSRAIINGEDYEVHEHDTTNGNHELRVVNGGGTAGKYARSPSAAITNKLVHWELSKEFRWAMDSGVRYSGVQSLASKTLILTNGKGPLMEYDGNRTRELYADTESWFAQKIAGEYAARLTEDETEFTLSAENQLHTKPPKGDFICDYKGHLMVADGETNEIRYSWTMNPYLWPLGNFLTIRDSFNNKITGMATLNDMLYVFTPTQVFSCGPFNADGKLSARPSSHGIGFVSHWAVQRVAVSGQSVLLGASSDGVYAYNGMEPVAVLDDWSRVLDGGVNQAKLSGAVAAVHQGKNRFYLAVPSAGSDKNDKILVYDYFRKAWWVWTAPFGVSYMATDFDEKGTERVLFGTNDGHIQVLVDGVNDDGKAFTGTVRSAPVQPFMEREGSLVAALVSVADLGASQTLSVKTYLDKKETPVATKALTVDGRQSVYDTGVFDTATFADDRFIEKRINQPFKARGHKFQLEFSGTGKWKTRDVTLLARVLERRGK